MRRRASASLAAVALAAPALAGCATPTGPASYQVDEGKMGDGMAQHSVELLDDLIPDCAFAGSYQLDQYFSGGAWATEAWLCAETDQVVLAPVGP